MGMKIFTSDFETSTYDWLKQYGGCDDKARIWAYGYCEVGDENTFEYGTDLDEFMEQVCLKNTKNNGVYYFHNLAYDGRYILDWLFRNGYSYVDDEKQKHDKSFSLVIADTGQWYLMKVWKKVDKKKPIRCEFRDSMKLLNFSVDSIGNSFNLDTKKVKVEEEFYHRYREVGHVLTAEELEYLKNDVVVMAKAMAIMFSRGMDKLTIGACALNQFYKTFDGEKISECKQSFRKNFPVLTNLVDSELRFSYKGGWTYYNEPVFGKKNGKVKDGIVLDVNSLYPYVMSDRLLPYGEPIYFQGEYEPDELYPLYIVKFKCDFELKEKHLPTIQIDNMIHAFMPTEYVKSSKWETPILYMTNVDLELFLKHYDILGEIKYFYGWKFKGSRKLFCKYIDYWREEKIKATQEDNQPERQIAKWMLNNIYGKLATNPVKKHKIPFFDLEKNIVRYLKSDPSEGEPMYISGASFITAYAREITINVAQANYDRFIYADTDSVHLEGLELPKNVNIDSEEFGAWDLEFIFQKGQYIRAKTYMEYGYKPSKPNKKFTKITVAGLPARCHGQVTFKNFKKGAIYKDKLKPVTVPGGVVLAPDTFEIKG